MKNRILSAVRMPLSIRDWLKYVTQKKPKRRCDYPPNEALFARPSFHRLNSLANPDKWDDKEWLKIHMELETYSVDKHCFSKTKELAYRKGWERTRALYGLHSLGMITPNAKALGVGVGHEPLLFYLTDHVLEVIGTDPNGNAEWSMVHGKEGSAEILEDPSKYCTWRFDASKLKLLKMDAMALDFEAETSDFV